jgi:hypothetical protein
MKNLIICRKLLVDFFSVADPDLDLGSGAFLTPGSRIRDLGLVESQHPDLGSGIRDELPGSYFLELRNHFFGCFGVKILKFLMRIWDLGSGMETVRIRDPGLKKVGSWNQG